MLFPAALVLNLGGYVLGAALYGMLVVLVLAPPHGVAQRAARPGWPASSRLALMTGLLGVVWNLGALGIDLIRLSGAPAPPLLTVAAYAALGFLPAVVVHLVLDRAGLGDRAGTRWLRWSAILVACFAAGRHLLAAMGAMPVPDRLGLLVLTWGFTALVAVLLAVTRDAGRSRVVWVAALSVFAVSGLHLSTHDGTEPWWMALVGHHASLPLGLAILQQHDRFAFADLFLRRGLAILLLGGVVLGILLAMPALPDAAMPVTTAPGGLVLWLALWMAVAVTYPALQRLAGRIVDRVVLQRPDHAALRGRIGQAVSHAQDMPALFRTMATELDAAFGVTGVSHVMLDVHAPPSAPTVLLGHEAMALLPPVERPAAGLAAVALMPTVEAPQYAICVPPLPEGRRLLSDDLDLLQTVANLVGRRVDALRVAHERCEQALREEEMSRLHTEAELRALRAQLNPHFLFNALSTIGYLIQEAPTRAQETLMDLTGVLRGVLRRSSHEFSTLGDEVDLIRAYLDIERARFEERLHVELLVPEDLRVLPVPSLLLQPLVENAIKHGIAPLRAGGAVVVRATLTGETQGAQRLVVEIADTGAGATPAALAAGRARGLGLASVERRLRSHYGSAGHLDLTSHPGEGTQVAVTLPVTVATHITTRDPVEMHDTAHAGTVLENVRTSR
jgi:two-component system, LytTR family, sensor kinase